MKSIRNFFRNLFSFETRPEDPENIEELRVAFKERYHNFKLLLSANNLCLELMAEMEQALQGDRSYDMSFVRSGATSISVNVYRMIQSLHHLAPGKYAELDSRFDTIRKAVDAILKQTRALPAGRLILPLNALDKDMAEVAGSKMANLGEVKNRIHLKVPAGFVITSSAFKRFMDDNSLQVEIDRKLQAIDSGDIDALYSFCAETQQLVIRSRIPDDLQEAIRGAWEDLEAESGGSITVALRSSALGEDAEGSSFAGQYRSELNVSFEHVFQAYKEVIASKYSLQAITYRMNRGFRDEDILMCVGCLVMVDAVSGGVIYSRNPVSGGDDRIFINAVWGLPKSVVDGSVACDLFVASREPPMPIVEKVISPKARKFVCYPQEGICRMDLTEEESTRPCLTDDQAKKLAQIAIRIENHYAMPQDIEWAIAGNGQIHILQCRPLKQSRAGETGDAASDPELKSRRIAGGGVTASPGAGSGPVHLGDRGVDVLAFPEGAVLVARQALPRWASLLTRASAVITEQGGFAGHLANVAREFGVPALFGIPDAASILKQGQVITVDASRRAVYDGSIPELISGAGAVKTHLMEGSPVHEILKKVGRHIIPLHLLDPDSREFSPAGCNTFHDITRFIHEKSVIEMFDFGKNHNFSERSSKQLHYRVPMQWWVLNLDDGFGQEVPGKYVSLENIDSIPMKAFWKGFVAIPWDGPPALDRKGLLSVMYQSTANTALTPSLRSRYAERNYFMISRHFCSLSSRLGYHFSTIEALISERPRENYISFQFKGGAADTYRKLGRVHFIKDILEELGFRVNIKEDHLASRLENHDMAHMEKQMEILGYLTLHTRQLDMIMANPGSVNYYGKKLRKDIETLLQEE
ncbi:MAG: PEP/pyruvate-binding domain-containing protein [Desulfatirhabdiaceae bacterium]|nr:PEP/pyruvate-binding domain-containing protein [Desulfatirhabdiaceae bacterium]